MPGCPHVLGTEIQFTAPRQSYAYAEVDAAPALALVQRRARQVGLEHVSDDGATNRPMLDAEAQRGLVERVVAVREARGRQEPHATDARAHFDTGVRGNVQLAARADAGRGAVAEPQR